MTIREQFGYIDVYLFDQLLRGRIRPGMRVLDAGCGYGRNLVYLLRSGVDVFAVDSDPGAVLAVRGLAASLAPEMPATNVKVEAVESMTIPPASMDAVICSAVLHFSNDAEHFGRMLTEMWRVLAPKGLFFARVASNIGLERVLGDRAGKRMRLPDGSSRFVVDEPMLLEWTDRLGAELIDPIKTTNVQQQRCMTTWCLTKPADAGV